MDGNIQIDFLLLILNAFTGYNEEHCSSRYKVNDI